MEFLNSQNFQNSQKFLKLSELQKRSGRLKLSPGLFRKIMQSSKGLLNYLALVKLFGGQMEFLNSWGLLNLQGSRRI